jgi:ParB-like chromosome segregation protein Spo0J
MTGIESERDEVIETIPIRLLDIDKVEPLEETRRVRSAGIDREHVEHMVPNVANLPPIEVVVLGGGRYGILCGYHRYEAHLLAARKRIRAIVRDLPPENWYVYAVASNLTHGLPLSTEDRKRAVVELLGDRRKHGWSDRRIAKEVGLSDKTVAAVRDQMKKQGIVSENEYRILEDGRSYRSRRPVEEVPPPRPRTERSTHPWAPNGLAYQSGKATTRHLESDPSHGLTETHKAKATEVVLRLRDACGAWLAGAGYED